MTCQCWVCVEIRFNKNKLGTIILYRRKYFTKDQTLKSEPTFSKNIEFENGWNYNMHCKKTNNSMALTQFWYIYNIYLTELKNSLGGKSSRIHT